MKIFPFLNSVRNPLKPHLRRYLAFYVRAFALLQNKY